MRPRLGLGAALALLEFALAGVAYLWCVFIWWPIAETLRPALAPLGRWLREALDD